MISWITTVSDTPCPLYPVKLAIAEWSKRLHAYQVSHEVSHTYDASKFSAEHVWAESDLFFLDYGARHCYSAVLKPVLVTVVTWLAIMKQLLSLTQADVVSSIAFWVQGREGRSWKGENRMARRSCFGLQTPTTKDERVCSTGAPIRVYITSYVKIRKSIVVPI